MTDRENLFRPVHKGIRSMLYEFGQLVQTTDFADVDQSNTVARRLKQGLGESVANCVLCLLRSHSTHEEADIFARLQAFDADAVEMMMKEHGEVTRRIQDVASTCDELQGISAPGRRIEVGDRLNLAANDLFAFYLGHLNNEEATLVPLMWERFSDAQLREIRYHFYDRLPLPRFEEWLRWTLPALNLNELTVLFGGLLQEPSTARKADWIRMARETLAPDRYRALANRVGLAAG